MPHATTKATAVVRLRLCVPLSRTTGRRSQPIAIGSVRDPNPRRSNGSQISRDFNGSSLGNTRASGAQVRTVQALLSPVEIRDDTARADFVLSNGCCREPEGVVKMESDPRFSFRAVRMALNQRFAAMKPCLFFSWSGGKLGLVVLLAFLAAWTGSGTDFLGRIVGFSALPGSGMAFRGLGPLFPQAHAAPKQEDDSRARDLSREFKSLFRKKRSPEASKVASFVKRAARVDDPEVAIMLVRAALAQPSSRNYSRAVKAIRKYKKQVTIESLAELTKSSKNYQQRLLVLDGFGKRKLKTGVDVVRKAIYRALRQDRSVLVRVAAIMACSDRKEKDAIPALIDHLEDNGKARNRDWIECRQALYDLTAENFELVEDWRSFWETNKQTLDPRSLGKKGDDKTGRKKVRVKRSENAVSFFGEEIHSQNVIFVIDCSGSMILFDSDPRYRGKNEEYDRQRLQRAKQQTLKTIRKLSKKSRFNVITFNSRVDSWQKRVVPATHGNFRKVKKFVKGFQAVQFTHTLDALESAFRDPGVDTIVLLSDGSPFKSGMRDSAEADGYAKEILKRVKDLNVARKLTIHTFGFEGSGTYPRGTPYAGQSSGGGGGASKFLKRLAKRNNGVYKSID